MPEGHDHGKNLIGTSQIELVVKLLILRVFDLLANDNHSLPHGQAVACSFDHSLAAAAEEPFLTTG
jgi:hypothetical protein